MKATTRAIRRINTLRRKRRMRDIKKNSAKKSPNPLLKEIDAEMKQQEGFEDYYHLNLDEDDLYDDLYHNYNHDEDEYLLYQDPLPDDYFRVDLIGNNFSGHLHRMDDVLSDEGNFCQQLSSLTDVLSNLSTSLKVELVADLAKVNTELSKLIKV